MKTETSVVLYSDKTIRKLLEAECEHVSVIGGTFSVKQAYTDNWYVTYTINYPDKK